MNVFPPEQPAPSQGDLAQSYEVLCTPTTLLQVAADADCFATLPVVGGVVAVA